MKKSIINTLWANNIAVYNDCLPVTLHFIFDQESIETLFQAPHAQLHERFINQTILNSLGSSISWLGQMQCLQQTLLLSLSLEVYFLSVFHVSAQKNIINIILTGAKYFRCQQPILTYNMKFVTSMPHVFSQGSFSCLTLSWRDRLLTPSTDLAV